VIGEVVKEVIREVVVEVGRKNKFGGMTEDLETCSEISDESSYDKI
jgi:hypothetical protein